MDPHQIGVIIKRFESPDETRHMVKGRFDIVRLHGLTIGRATYEPGWKWSDHVGPSVGAARCHVEHVGLVLSGTATAAFEDGTVVELRAGELFYIPPDAARQLGGRRPALRLAALPRRRPLRRQGDPRMILILFRSKLTAAAGDDYARMAGEMDAHARTFPGFVDVKSYTGNADGERLTVVWWQDEETPRVWATDVRHLAAQRAGRERWYRVLRDRGRRDRARQQLRAPRRVRLKPDTGRSG